jgi:putative endonuclease
MNPRRARGRRAWREGHFAEWQAALYLMLTGWRILGFRLKSHGVEIDILALRHGVVAVVEVKRRRTLDEAFAAVTPMQLQRLRRAGAAVAAQRSDLRGLGVRIDLFALAPGRWPRHIPDAWPQN